MTDTLATEADPADVARRARIGAALAAEGGALGHASLALGVAGLALGAILIRIDPRGLGPLAAITAAQAGLTTLGLVLALRTRLDARLFADLARDPDLSAFDRAMTDLRLLPVAKTGRPIADRIAGVNRLLRLQGLGLALQLAALVLLLAPGTP